MFLATIAPAAAAHDYWLVPLSREGDVVPVSLVVGEDFVIQEDKHFEGARTPRAVVVHRGRQEPAETVEGATPFLRMNVASVGGHLLVVDRNAATITLAPAEFETYLHSEGLDAVVEERARRGESSLPGRERYSRCLKALVQTGDAHDDTFAFDAHQTLEIVPDRDPVRALPGSTLGVAMKFHGEPLAGARFDALSRVGDDVQSKAYTTDDRGRASITIDRRAEWLVRTVHMTRCDRCTDADWESTWASYTFTSSSEHAPPSKKRFVAIVVALVLGLALWIVSRDSRRGGSSGPACT